MIRARMVAAHSQKRILSMSDYAVRPIRKPLDALVQVPGSKSETNRALLLAALADGTSALTDVLFSADSRAFLSCLQDLGFSVEIQEQERYVAVKGEGGAIPGEDVNIYTGSAGTASRFLTALLALREGNWEICCSEQMSRRPMKELFDTLTQLGASFTYVGQEGHLPVRVKGAARPRHETSIATDTSTQFLSALLMTAPVLPDGLVLHAQGGRADGAYVKMTTDLMKRFGVNVHHETGSAIFEVAAGQAYRAGHYAIEPDMSAAAYFYAAAAICGGAVIVRGVKRTSLQGDIRFLSVLREMGCMLQETPEGIRVTGPGRGRLHGVDVNMKDFSDQALTLAAIAPFADSPTTIRGIGHIRKQESDRIKAIEVNLGRLGIECEAGDDFVKIWPGTPKPARIETFDDHRVAMAFAITGLAADGVVIKDQECVGKTFEDFFDVLQTLYEPEHLS